MLHAYTESRKAATAGLSPTWATRDDEPPSSKRDNDHDSPMSKTYIGDCDILMRAIARPPGISRGVVQQ